jgi:hypothetical protein
MPTGVFMKSSHISRRTIRPTLAIALVTAVLLGAPNGTEAQSAPAAVSPAPGSLASAAAAITPETVFEHLYVLASDGMRGRDTPSPGLEAAAAYLVSRHRGNGLVPAGEDGTWYQRYPFRLLGPDLEATRLALRGPGATVTIVPGDNGFVRGYAPDALDGTLVTLGNPEAGSLEADALEGRVMLARLPGEWDQALWRRALDQAALARTAGARAVIHVLDDAFPSETLAQLSRNLSGPQWRLGDDPHFPQIFIRAGSLAEALADMEPAWEPGPRTLDGVALEGRIPWRIHQDATPPNVLAMLPGSDPALRHEYVVLSAHFDHVGVGQPMDGDSIYNGADDNASGTTALLEVARALASLPEAPRRSVLFAHVSGEEKGLLGARWFVDNPTVPAEHMVANINADMVGSDTHPDTVVIIGKDYSDLGPLVEEVNSGLPDLRLVTSPDLWPEQRLFYRSDQFHFMRKEIPSLFFFTGLHECYHRPCDTIDFVDPDKIARITRLITHVVVEIANRDGRPEWDPAGLAEVREMVAGGR